MICVSKGFPHFPHPDCGLWDVPAKLALTEVMELVQGGELFDEIVRVGAFTEPAARYVSWLSGENGSSAATHRLRKTRSHFE